MWQILITTIPEFCDHFEFLVTKPTIRITHALSIWQYLEKLFFSSPCNAAQETNSQFLVSEALRSSEESCPTF